MHLPVKEVNSSDHKPQGCRYSATSARLSHDLWIPVFTDSFMDTEVAVNSRWHTTHDIMRTAGTLFALGAISLYYQEAVSVSNSLLRLDQHVLGFAPNLDTLLLEKLLV